MGLDAFSTIAPNGTKIYFGTAAPSVAGDGTFSAGDKVLYNGSSTKSALGWICTASGTPGTWEAISDTYQVNFNVIAGAAAADYDGLIINRFAGKLVRVVERHAVAGSNGGAVTLMLKKVPSGTAKASGTDMLSAGLNMKSTADTNQSGSLHGTAANLLVADGDAFGLVLTGTGTDLDSVSLMAEFLRL